VKSRCPRAWRIMVTACSFNDRRQLRPLRPPSGGDLPEYDVLGRRSRLASWTQLKAAAGRVGGSSSGCRLSLLFARSEIACTRFASLLSMAVTGGSFCRDAPHRELLRLQNTTSTTTPSASRYGGQLCVLSLFDHCKERIERAVEPRGRSLAIGSEGLQHIAAMERWREQFRQAAALLPSSSRRAESGPRSSPDLHHSSATTRPTTTTDASSQSAHRMIPVIELHYLFPGDLTSNLVPQEDGWAPREGDNVARCRGFPWRASSEGA